MPPKEGAVGLKAAGEERVLGQVDVREHHDE
jgi:hypothetical protein